MGHPHGHELGPFIKIRTHLKTTIAEVALGTPLQHHGWGRVTSMYAPSI